MKEKAPNTSELYERMELDLELEVNATDHVGLLLVATILSSSPKAVQNN